MRNLSDYVKVGAAVLGMAVQGCCAHSSLDNSNVVNQPVQSGVFPTLNINRSPRTVEATLGLIRTMCRRLPQESWAMDGGVFCLDENNRAIPLQNPGPITLSPVPCEKESAHVIDDVTTPLQTAVSECAAKGGVLNFGVLFFASGVRNEQ